MKKMMLIWLTFGLFGPYFAGVSHASGKTYSMVILQDNSIGRQEVAQMIMLLKNVSDGLFKRTGIRIQIESVATKKVLEERVLKKSVDFLLNYSSIALANGFDPIGSFGLFNEPLPAECIFVKKDSPYQKIGDLRNKSFATRFDASSRFSYLGFLVGGSPFKFFNPLKGARNDGSLAYMVSLGQAEAALIHVWVMGLMKLNNPGPVKGLRRITCSKACPEIIVASPKVTPQDRITIMNFLAGARSAPELKHLRGMLNAMGLQIRHFSKKEYGMCKNWVERMEKAFPKNDWEREFNMWSAMEENRTRHQ